MYAWLFCAHSFVNAVEAYRFTTCTAQQKRHGSCMNDSLLRSVPVDDVRETCFLPQSSERRLAAPARGAKEASKGRFGWLCDVLRFVIER